MVVDWFVLGAVDGCLPDSADNIHGMDSAPLAAKAQTDGALQAS